MSDKHYLIYERKDKIIIKDSIKAEEIEEIVNDLIESNRYLRGGMIQKIFGFIMKLEKNLPLKKICKKQSFTFLKLMNFLL